jgi:hypothetical protein
MNTATLKEPISPPMQDKVENEFEYRSISRAAIAAVIFTVLSPTAFMVEPLVFVPLLGLGLSILALVNLRRFPEELIGLSAAKISLLVSLVVLVSSASRHTYVYLTEVPDGCVRMSFSDLRPNTRTPLPYSEKAAELDGKRVFVRGYVRPGAKKRKLKEFILVGDWGTCCFGGNPKITDVVAVSIAGDQTVDYGYSVRRIVGTFRLNKNTRLTNEKDIPEVFYEIEAEQVR